MAVEAGLQRSFSGIAASEFESVAGCSREAYDIASSARVRLPQLGQTSSAELMKGLTQAAWQPVQLANAPTKAVAIATVEATQVVTASKG